MKSKIYWYTFVLSLLGLIDSAYLIWIKIADSPKFCIQGVGDCWSVNRSQYSQIAGIPVSVLGVIAYLIIFILLLTENRTDFLKQYTVMAQFGITLVGFLFSAYLTYIELFVLKAICPFCVVSAIVMTCLFILTVARLRKSLVEIT